MFDETCKWQRTKPLVWQTECNHQIGTPKAWEPIEGMACICCKKPVEVVNDGSIMDSASVRAGAGAL